MWLSLFLICVRHVIESRAVTIGMFHAFATWSELPSNITQGFVFFLVLCFFLSLIDTLVLLLLYNVVFIFQVSKSQHLGSW